MSKYMTLEELFKELKLNRQAIIRAMRTADNKSAVLARKVRMNWRNSGWKDALEEQRELGNDGCLWSYGANSSQFLFLRADKLKVIDILEVETGSEDYLLGATNER
jgi:hypothetical protein